MHGVRRLQLRKAHFVGDKTLRVVGELPNEISQSFVRIDENALSHLLLRLVAASIAARSGPSAGRARTLCLGACDEDLRRQLRTDRATGMFDAEGDRSFKGLTRDDLHTRPGNNTELGEIPKTVPVAV